MVRQGVVLCLAVCASACGSRQPVRPVVATAAVVSAVASASATVVATPSPTPTPCSTESVLNEWSARELAWQVVMVPARLTDVGGVAPAVAAGAGGVLLFGATGPADLAAQIAALPRPARKVPAFWATDAEGGVVLRDANNLGPVPSARSLAATATPAGIRSTAAALGRRMRGAGMTMDLAPVADEDAGPGPDDQHPDGTRSFSADPRVASTAVVAFAAGLRDAGILAAVKHFPGLGGAVGNSDITPSTTLPWATLQSNGALDPFRAAVRDGIPVAMMSNYAVPGLTTAPASVAPQAYQALRQLGFHGLVVTDSMSARTFLDTGYTIGSASVAALVAGADMVMFGFVGTGDDAALVREGLANAQATVDAISGAVDKGTLQRQRLTEAVSHVLAAKGVDLCAAGA